MHLAPRIKICCIQSIEEARLAVSHGASALGLVSAMPSGPGPIPESAIARIAAIVPPGIATFLLTCAATAEAVIDQQRRCCVNTIQLVSPVDTAQYAPMRASMPGIKLVQVVHVVDEAALASAHEAAPHVDAILLDTGEPDAAVPVLGGTGRTHDWDVSRRIVDTVDVPVWLAGGLSGVNVASAMATVRPFGIDVCSGVRTDGGLDESKLRSFMEAAR